MTRCRSIERRGTPPTSGVAHDDDLAAERQHREAEHAGGVGERREREVDRAALERVAHQRERGHRLEVAAGEHHALGPPGRAAGADDHRQVVRPGRRRPSVAGASEPGTRPSVSAPVDVAVEADQRRAASAGRRGSASTSGAKALWKISARAVEQVEQLAVLGRLVARVDRAPHGAGAADAEHAGERDRVVGRQDRDLVAGRDARARRSARGDAAAERPAPRRRTACAPSVVRQGASRPERRALVEVVDERARTAVSPRR